MVDWNKIAQALRRIPSVGMPGMHLSQQSSSYSNTSTSSSTSTPPVTPVAPTPPEVEQETPTQITLEAATSRPTPAPNVTDVPENISMTPLFFIPRDTPLTNQEQEAGTVALQHRLANVTSSFEAPINPQTQMPDRRTPTAEELRQGEDVPLLMPSTRFYWCRGDRRAGLTVGYGTFFTKQQRLTPEDQSLLPSLQILNENTRQQITGNQPKANVIHELFPHIRNNERLRSQPYTVPVASADAMLRQRFIEKTTDLDRLLSARGRREVAPRDVLVDWVASDLYYQGALSSRTGIPDFAENTINKSKLSRSPQPTNLRLTARRTCSDLQRIVNANPFTPQMDEIQRQQHAQDLAEYCTAYAAHQMTKANPQYYYTRNHVQAHIQDLSSLAIMDIARNYYGRNLTREEILRCASNAGEISGRIFASNNPQLYALRLSVSKEDDIQNPAGHYHATPELLARAQSSPIPSPQANNNQNQENRPNLSARLQQSGQNISNQPAVTRTPQANERA